MACRRTLREKVYIAKLAVLISIPKIYTTHCLKSLTVFEVMMSIPGGIDGLVELDPHGVFRSESRTPFSRANCSRVIGMNDPEFRY